jgi:hypothetical protein
MKIVMLETKQGSEDGFTVRTYYKDESYEIRENLYNIFKSNKWCKDFVEVEKFEEPIKSKKIEVPENKMAEIPENKIIEDKKKAVK